MQDFIVLASGWILPALMAMAALWVLTDMIVDTVKDFLKKMRS